MNQDEFAMLLITLEGITKAILEIKDELAVMNNEGVVIFAGSGHLEN